MRAKLDESMPTEAAGILRSAGWECDTVHDEGLSGEQDSRIAEVCRAEARVLFTIDLDFADIRAYPPRDYVGIVVLRPIRPSRDLTLTLLTQALTTLASEWLEHRLWIVEPGRVRVRGEHDTSGEERLD